MQGGENEFVKVAMKFPNLRDFPQLLSFENSLLLPLHPLLIRTVLGGYQIKLTKTTRLKNSPTVSRLQSDG